MKKYLNDVDDAPKALGPYSQAVRAGGDLLFISGQLGIDPTSGQLVPGGVIEQCEQVLKNLATILKHEELGFADVVKTVIFLQNMADFKSVNAIYEQRLGSARPARATVQVAALPLAALIEIEMIASYR